MGNGKINGGSNSGGLTTFELLNEHAEKSESLGCVWAKQPIADKF